MLFSTFFVFFLSLTAVVQAHIAQFDDYWVQRALEAQKTANNSYNPNPELVTDQVNTEVGKALIGTNSTRRSLRHGHSHKDPCLSTNPIDNKWRCDPNWMNNRKKLASAVLGFGHKTTGGLMGRFYTVTDPTDNDMINPKPGTLRHAVIQKGPLWIIFSKSMIITLKNELIVTSDKTIDARGANVRIAYGAGITLQFINNVIIHGLHIHDIVVKPGGLIRDSVDHIGYRTASDGDGISIFGSSNIWIDHISMSNCADGLIDAVQGSTAITISNCHMTRHNDVMLFGASDSYTGDKIMQITVAFNHFGRGLVQRMPRARYGFIHVVNNDYTTWLMYAIGGSSNPTIISQGNRFVAPANAAAKEVTNRNYATPSVWKNWVWISQGDYMVNGAFFRQSGVANLKGFSKKQLIKFKPGKAVSRLTRFSGSLDCVRGFMC
ncbi:hypothetical protein ACFE04_024451 [Oxalis oulophora]